MLNKISFFAFFASSLSCISALKAEILDPINSVVPISAKPYFIMGSAVPKAEWYAFDHKAYLAVSSVVYNSSSIYMNGQPLMPKPSTVCSIYDSGVCFDVSELYNPSYPQVIFSGMFASNADTIFSFGFNSGFSSPKVTVTPAIMLGLSKRFYVGNIKERDSHIILEANSWFAGSVKHSPCYDSFDRAYYCANLSAWNDFSYHSSEQSFSIFIWYEKLF
jgi:hypothetical protein